MKATLDHLVSVVQNAVKHNVAQASSHDLPGPSKSKSGDGANTYAQLNVDEFQNVEYHLEFDPIAAAQGEYRRLPRNEQLAAAAESGVEPIAIDPEPVARWV
ncbi:hypothetical protein Aduo_001983 [Ancylostoma duodenale]